LAERGYYKGEVNGQWDNASMDAFKRFQADQKLEPDGKINALSLINLGLGPKHDGGALASTVAVMPASSTAQPAQPSN
jgi:peptidoglycan hydrolase-like protein with peptidoglycan-binding domain